MAVSDYTGRTVDLLLAQGASTAGGMQELSPGLNWDEGGQITTGIQKAAQFFLVTFMTEKGSRVQDTDFGTKFIGEVRRANMTDAFMEIVFREAAEDVLDQQNRAQDADAPDDEVLTDAELISYTSATQSELALTVELVTVAGTSRTVIVPISLAIK